MFDISSFRPPTHVELFWRQGAPVGDLAGLHITSKNPLVFETDEFKWCRYLGPCVELGPKCYIAEFPYKNASKKSQVTLSHLPLWKKFFDISGSRGVPKMDIFLCVRGDIAP